MGWVARQIPQDYPSQKPKDLGPKTPPEPPERPYMAVLVIVIAILLVAVYVGFYLPTLNNPVNITSLNFASSDDACGTNGLMWGSYSVGLHAVIPFAFSVQNENSAVACTIRYITTTTTGFTVNGANTPLTVPAYTGGTLGSTSRYRAIPTSVCSLSIWSEARPTEPVSLPLRAR